SSMSSACTIRASTSWARASLSKPLRPMAGSRRSPPRSMARLCSRCSGTPNGRRTITPTARCSSRCLAARCAANRSPEPARFATEQNKRKRPMARNYDIPELRRLDIAHHLPAQANYAEIVSLGGSRIITRAEGSTIYDGEGNAILDGMAGLWCVNVGYGREELVEAATQQMRELPFYNTFFKTATPPTVMLAAKLAELLGGKLRHVFFNSSGSEANDTVMRLARYYWKLKGQPNRTIFISRRNAYHGSTMAGASLGGMAHMHPVGGLPIPGVEHVAQPYKFNEGWGEDEDAFSARVAQEIEDRIIAVGPENVCAFIGEPVQGAGGVIIPPKGYWRRVQEICRKHGILLVVDEVICCFGRLGEWFGFQQYGLEPDLVPMAKGLSSGYLPISAVGVSEEIVAVLREHNVEFTHGYTYSGHPVAAAVALKNIEIIERE